MQFFVKLCLLPLRGEGLFSKNQCCGTGMLISDPNFSHSESRIKKIPDPGSGSASNNLSILSPKNCFQALKKNDLGCSSRIRIFSMAGSRIQASKAPDPVSGSAALCKMRDFFPFLARSPCEVAAYFCDIPMHLPFLTTNKNL
jgi:hypothetical protein